jgi:glycosyltransferase involved in cell wall biosynthesis
MKTALIICQNGLTDDAARGEQLRARSEQLEEFGWNIELGLIPEAISKLGSLGWIIRYDKIINIIQNHRGSVDLVNTMNYPPGNHLAGYIISEKLDVPWVSEFRDPLVQNENTMDMRLSPRIAGFLRRKLEKIVVARADRIMWSDGSHLGGNYFADNYPEYDQNKFCLLPFQGFVKNNFEDVPRTNFDEFTIVYAGSFYGGRIEPFVFLEGLEKYIEKSKEELTLQVFGGWSKRHENKAEALGIDDHVISHDWVPHEEVVKALIGADACLYIHSNSENAKEHIGSKTWDYLGARTPILSISDDDARISKFINKNNFGIVSPPDPEKVSECLHKLVQKDYVFDSSWESRDEFRRINKTREIANVYDDLV